MTGSPKVRLQKVKSSKVCLHHGQQDLSGNIFDLFKTSFNSVRPCRLKADNKRSFCLIGNIVWQFTRYRPSKRVVIPSHFSKEQFDTLIDMFLDISQVHGRFASDRNIRDWVVFFI